MNKYQEALRKVKFIIDDEWGNGVSDKNEDIQVLQALVDKETFKKPIKSAYVQKDEYDKIIDGLKCECPHCHTEECRRLEENCYEDEYYYQENERCDVCGGLLDWSKE